MKELKEIIQGAMADYKSRKVDNAKVDDDMDFEIYNEVESTTRRILESIEELDATIDMIIEEADEMSLEEYDLMEDAKLRTRDLIGG